MDKKWTVVYSQVDGRGGQKRVMWFGLRRNFNFICRDLEKTRGPFSVNTVLRHRRVVDTYKGRPFGEAGCARGTSSRRNRNENERWTGTTLQTASDFFDRMQWAVVHGLASCKDI